jgi:hypothetical protein
VKSANDRSLLELPNAMNENDDIPPLSRTKGRLFLVTTPSPEDLIRAAKIPAHCCPRRYCWWWRTLSFDWDLMPSEGCTFVTSPKPPRMINADFPCCRCASSSTVDHYEPREPHLLQDGFAVPRWQTLEHGRPNGEISYDLVMEDDMGFAEGSYRIESCEWCVVIFSKRPIEQLSWKTGAWDSGVTGIEVHVPLNIQLNAPAIESLLSSILGVAAWKRVRGPDSMQLR